jgi:hypothetical protein
VYRPRPGDSHHHRAGVKRSQAEPAGVTEK